MQLRAHAPGARSSSTSSGASRRRAACVSLPLARRSRALWRVAAAVEESSSTATETVPVKVPWWDRTATPNMKNVTGGIQELVDELANAGDKLTVVEFYAPWCAACKAVFPKICQIVGEHQEDLVFLKVSYEDNKDMCRTMGVKVLPTIHMYHGSLGRVANFTVTLSKVQRFRDALEEHLGAICSLEEPGALVEEFPEVHPHHSLILETHDDDMYDHPPPPVFTSPDVPTRLPE